MPVSSHDWLFCCAVIDFSMFIIVVAWLVDKCLNAYNRRTDVMDEGNRDRRHEYYQRR